jgi:HSP20 family protein
MATLTRWDPFGEMQRLTDQLFRTWSPDERRGFAPAVDIYEDEDAIVVKAELPGVKPEDVNISVENNVLTMSGERKLERSEEREGYHRIESSYGAFTRSFALPESLRTDEVEAEMNEGVLKVRIPKKPEVAPKRIQVKGHGEEPKQVAAPGQAEAKKEAKEQPAGSQAETAKTFPTK